MVVDAEPRLDGDGHGDSGAHRGDALGHARGLEHQRGAETAGLDAVARTADVEIDLVVAGRSAEFRRGCELAGIAAAELQRDGVLGRHRSAAAGRASPCSNARAVIISVYNRARGANRRSKIPQVPVRAVHHRRNAQSVREVM